MALPKPIRPEYNTTIPSTGKKIRYQPFSVKEEKVLILAAESGDIDEVTNAITNVLQRCITSPTDLSVDELALFDIEYLFLRTRAKSAGETIKVKVTDPEDESYSVEHEINIDKITVKKEAEHTDLIKISEDISIKMKYPGIRFFAEGINVDDMQTSIETVAKCVGQIVVGEEVYNRADMTEEEIIDWLESLTTEQFTKVMEFFKTMPKMSHTIKLKNKKTNKDFSVVLEGLSDFF